MSDMHAASLIINDAAPGRSLHVTYEVILVRGEGAVDEPERVDITGSLTDDIVVAARPGEPTRVMLPLEQGAMTLCLDPSEVKIQGVSVLCPPLREQPGQNPARPHEECWIIYVDKITLGFRG